MSLSPEKILSLKKCGSNGWIGMSNSRFLLLYSGAFVVLWYVIALAISLNGLQGYHDKSAPGGYVASFGRLDSPEGASALAALEPFPLLSRSEYELTGPFGRPLTENNGAIEYYIKPINLKAKILVAAFAARFEIFLSAFLIGAVLYGTGKLAGKNRPAAWMKYVHVAFFSTCLYGLLLVPWEGYR